jgi:hypothetical protein
MRFHRMKPLEAAYPHIELEHEGERFDVHNAGTLERMGLDFEAGCFEVTWRVENTLRDARCGSYATARVVLRVCGVTAVAGTVDLLSIRRRRRASTSSSTSPSGRKRGASASCSCGTGRSPYPGRTASFATRS